MKHVLRVINVLATVVILVAFVVLLRTVFTPAGEIPTIMGYGFMRTLTGSMEPAIPVHSFIVVDTDNSQAYQVGDIITFHSSDDALEGSLNTHRIVAVEDAADGTPVYRTKGDANPVEDAAPVPAADVVGRVVFVSAGLGVVVSLLTNPLLFFPLVVVPLIVLLVLEIRHMVKTTRWHAPRTRPPCEPPLSRFAKSAVASRRAGTATRTGTMASMLREVRKPPPAP